MNEVIWEIFPFIVLSQVCVFLLSKIVKMCCINILGHNIMNYYFSKEWLINIWNILNIINTDDMFYLNREWRIPTRNEMDVEGKIVNNLLYEMMKNVLYLSDKTFSTLKGNITYPIYLHITYYYHTRHNYMYTCNYNRKINFHTCFYWLFISYMSLCCVNETFSMNCNLQFVNLLY